MTPVEFCFLTPDGKPLVGAEFEVQLSESAYNTIDTGVLMPRIVSAKTDLEGKAQLLLWPSTELYYLSMQDSESDAGIGFKFIVPAVDGATEYVRFQDIIVETGLKPGDFDVELLSSILSAKSIVLAAKEIVVLNREQAEQAADTALAAQQIAESSIEIVRTASTDAVNAAIDAGNSKDVSNTNAATAIDAAASANTAKDTANTAAYNAAQSAVTAVNKADLAVTNAGAALVSETNAKNSETAAGVAKAAAEQARDAAVAAKNTAVTKASEAATSAEQAATNAAQLAAQLYAFNEMYIGKFAVAPALDGNGNALKVGAIYENTVEGKFFQYESDHTWHAYDEESTSALSNAILSANSAAGSASAASTSETNAANSATEASTNAGVILARIGEATTSAANAKTSETNAKASEIAAQGSKGAAATSESNAKTSETNAAGSASTSSTKAGEAATSAAAAKTSETNAATSASTASTAASNAGTSATTASTKAGEAATSAQNASTSAATATQKAADASQSAANAATSAQAAISRGPRIQVQDRRPKGTASQTVTKDGTGGVLMIPREMQTVRKNTILGAAINGSNNGVSLPAGTYRVSGHVATAVGNNQYQLYDATNNAELDVTVNQNSGTGGSGLAYGVAVPFETEFTLNTDAVVQIREPIANSVAATVSLAATANVLTEIYLNLIFEKMA